MTEIQYVSDESGKPVGVIVPIELWREIESEKETAYLLKSENMKRRLLEAKSDDPILQLGKHLIVCDVEVASENHDTYLSV